MKIEKLFPSSRFTSVLSFSFVPLMVALLTLPNAAADDKKSDDKNSSDETTREIRVESVVTGQKIKIGPDGKVEILDLGTAGKKIPKAVQDQIQAALKKGGKAFTLNMNVDSESISDSDDDSDEGDLKKVISGSIIMVGPDGKRSTVNFGGDGASKDNVKKTIEKMLSQQGDLSDDVRKQVLDALKVVPDRLGKIDFDGVQMLRVNPKKMAKQDAKKSSIMEKLDSKLDKILSRLDTLETEVEKLKSKN
ncbi:MAG: hypothetical protein AAF958_04895 [Planctomycetota bacterium]